MDSKEFEALFVIHRGGLYNLALRLTDNVRDAEDLLQETLLKAWRFRDRFEQGTNARAWISTILRNTFINEYRKTRKHVEVSIGKAEYQYAAPEIATDLSGIEEEELKKHFSDPMFNALHHIPECYRTAMLLCDVFGLSYKDAAARIGCPEGTVMSRLFRARRRMQDGLAFFVERTPRGIAPKNDHFNTTPSAAKKR